MHLVGCTIGMYCDERTYERQIQRLGFHIHCQSITFRTKILYAFLCPLISLIDKTATTSNYVHTKFCT